jgi:hypothetical protein
MSHGEIAVLRLVGSADSAATQPLGELLDQIHDELISKQTPEVVVDLRSLDHMAAACLRQLLAWFGRQHNTTEEQRYRIRIRILPAMAWQQSLHALSCFDTNTISIET